MRFEAAVQMEQDSADDLRWASYPVTGWHGRPHAENKRAEARQTPCEASGAFWGKLPMLTPLLVRHINPCEAQLLSEPDAHFLAASGGSDQ